MGTEVQEMNHIIYTDIKQRSAGYIVLDNDGEPYTHDVLLGDTCEYHLPWNEVRSLIVVTTNKHTCEDCSLDIGGACPRRKDGTCVLYNGGNGPRLAFKCLDSILEEL